MHFLLCMTVATCTVEPCHDVARTIYLIQCDWLGSKQNTVVWSFISSLRPFVSRNHWSNYPSFVTPPLTKPFFEKTMACPIVTRKVAYRPFQKEPSYGVNSFGSHKLTIELGFRLFVKGRPIYWPHLGAAWLYLGKTSSIVSVSADPTLDTLRWPTSLPARVPHVSVAPTKAITIIHAKIWQNCTNIVGFMEMVGGWNFRNCVLQ